MTNYKVKDEMGEATQVVQAKQQQILHTKLWAIANDLRGNMDASEFKNYMLGLIFYRYLSEQLVEYIDNQLKDDDTNYQEAWDDEEMRKEIVDDLTSDSGLGYVIEPQYLWSNMISKIKTGEFGISMLAKAIGSLSTSIQGTSSEHDFAGLFDDMDLDSSRLGKSDADRSKLIGKVMQRINEIDFHVSDAEIDILGDAYEYLIGQFASSAGKKAGEFYTPQQVSKLLAKIVTYGKEKLKNVYDPTCGSGSLLLRVGQEVKGNVSKYYGQEMVSTTYNLARMNLILHGVRPQRFDLENNDTIEHPCERHKDMRFEAVVANPPYSAKWSADPTRFGDDERFNGFSKLPPKSKADYAFVLHMLYLLADDGTMSVVLPHGVLFRGAAEGEIRKTLIKEENVLDAVIGLPANLFYGTTIPTCVLVFKKCRKNSDNIIFIDASREFEAGKNQNRLTDENIQKIMDTYIARKDVDKYAHVASMKEIEDNEYNLNIPRYVDTFEEEEPIDIQKVLADLKSLKEESAKLDEEIDKNLRELGLIK